MLVVEPMFGHVNAHWTQTMLHSLFPAPFEIFPRREFCALPCCVLILCFSTSISGPMFGFLSVPVGLLTLSKPRQMAEVRAVLNIRAKIKAWKVESQGSPRMRPFFGGDSYHVLFMFSWQSLPTTPCGYATLLK